MNQRLLVVNRKVGKITDALSETGGLISILISVIAFFMAGYNANRYELTVADRTFRDD